MADVLDVREQYRLETWAGVIQECQQSGLTNREFCRQRGISEKTYYHWLRKLREKAIASVPQLVPLEPSPEQPQDLLEIRYRGAELQLPGRTDIDAVAAVLRSLQQL